MDQDDLWREYQEIGHNIRWLGDVRFRLLALAPSVSGLAVALLPQVDANRPLPRSLSHCSGS